MEKLRNGKWASDKATAEEMKKAVAELRGYVQQYGWEDKMVYPYGFGINIVEFLDGFADYERCTPASKSIKIQEINGLIEIINAWVKLEQEEKVTIRLLKGNKAGQVKEIAASLAEDYVDCGLAELIQTERR